MTSLPERMKAIAITEPGGPEVLQPVEVARPDPGPGEVLVKVAAAGVNRPDVIQRKGLYPPPPGASPLPGLEIAGEVVALGQGVSRYRLGDKVTALVTGGGYAEYCPAHEGSALSWPAGYDAVRAAALPETFFTVWHNLFYRGGLAAGETILIHGGSSGIGTTAIQLAKAFGARVFATAGSAEKCAACTELGADLAINYRETDFVEAVKQATSGRGVEFILDMVGGEYIQKNILCAADEGRIHQIAFLNGPKATVDFTRLMIKRLTLTGSTLRPRTAEVKAELARGLETQVWPLLTAGTAKPIIDSTFPLDKASEAHARMETNAHIGKIILTI
jgi:NADPH2:quinone reductase